MMGDGSKQAFAATYAWVLMSSTIVFMKGHMGAKTVSE
jgi:hypothetical protein